MIPKYQHFEDFQASSSQTLGPSFSLLLKEKKTSFSAFYNTNWLPHCE